MEYVGEGNQIINWNYKNVLDSEYTNYLLSHIFETPGVLKSNSYITNDNKNIEIGPEFSAIITPLYLESTYVKIDTFDTYTVYWPHIFESKITDWLKDNPNGFNDYLNEYVSNNPSEYPNFVEKYRTYIECLMEFPLVFEQFFIDYPNLNPGRRDENRTRIIARFVWKEIESNYVEFLCINPKNTLETDLIIVDYETYIDPIEYLSDPNNATVTIVPGSLNYSNTISPKLNRNLLKYQDVCNTIEGTTANYLNGKVAGLDFPINDNVININLNSDKLSGYDAGHESGKLSINDGVLNDNLVSEMIGSPSQLPIKIGNDSEIEDKIPISNQLLCKRLNAQYFNGKEDYEIFYNTHQHTLDDNELNSILDDSTYRKVSGINSNGLASESSIDDNAFKYKHQSITDINNSFYTINNSPKKLFIHHDKGLNDYRIYNSTYPGDDIEIPSPNFINIPSIIGGSSNTAGYRYNSGNQIIYNINTSGNIWSFKSYGIKTTSNLDTNGEILTNFSSDVSDLSYIAFGEREDL